MTRVPLRLIALLALALAPALVACGPIGPLSGGRLRGESAPLPASFSAWADVENAQLETHPEDPHSINIWWVCVDDAAFVSTSLILGPKEPKERAWVTHVEADPRVRLRLDGTVFDARLLRLDDAGLRERVLAAFADKYGEISAERRATAWVYRVAAR